MFNLPQNQNFDFRLPLQSTSNSPFPHLLPSQSSSSYPTSGPPGDEAWLHLQHPQIQINPQPKGQPLSSNPFLLDEAEDQTELYELGSDDQLLSMPHSRVVRRRSSKACDQCRKSKCKCERTSPNARCRNCVLLGTPCTFLGPSRKRGPPKGYIDALEGRLYQTEALLSVVLSSNDPRAMGLVADLMQDPLAKEILNRIARDPYKPKGVVDAGASTGKTSGSSRLSFAPSIHRAPPSTSASCMTPTSGSQSPTASGEGETVGYPSSEWRNRISTMLQAVDAQRSAALPLTSPTNTDAPAETGVAQGRRQRRRVEPEFGGDPSSQIDDPTAMSGLERRALYRDVKAESESSSEETEEDESLREATGQLSLNEDQQVRFHGKVSGLHLLGSKERVDKRNEGGIWRFPKGGVWPPRPETRETTNSMDAEPQEEENIDMLISREMQEHLLDLYFTYIHPSFPIIHKKVFFEIYRSPHLGPGSPESVSDKSSSPFSQRLRVIPTLLLLTMLSIAARLTVGCLNNNGHPLTPSIAPPLPSSPRSMWAAGDDLCARAYALLARSCAYARSRPSTVQALLLLAFREVGIGAMAQAWTYTGMAVRMAQDLGMHRKADGWARETLGGRLFSEDEVEERRRIWAGCVVFDKYVSCYIGRPVCIWERDFDTLLPSINDSEELETWTPHSSLPIQSVASNDTEQLQPQTRSRWASQDTLSPTTGHVVSCFNASLTLSNITGMMMESIYAVRPAARRFLDAVRIEARLDKWFIELPAHLRYDPSAAAAKGDAVPSPHVITLQLQYWCTVLLLHRPFIRNSDSKPKSPEVATPTSIPSGTEESADATRVSAEKAYELCASAANHIVSIASVYAEHHGLKRTSIFMCYYVFTASIMHVTSLTKYPSDPQSAAGLRKCMDILADMEIVWPSAGRQLELLRGSKLYLELKEHGGDFSPRRGREGHGQKRLAEQDLEEKETWPEIRRDVPQQYMRQVPGPKAHSRARTASMTLVPGTHPKLTHGHARSSSVVPSSTVVGPRLAATVPPPSASSPATLSPSFERWLLEMEWPLSESLSTSVFSPFYGTGNTDEYGMQRYPAVAPNSISPSGTAFQSGQHGPQHSDTDRGLQSDSWDDSAGAIQQSYPTYDTSITASANAPELFRAQEGNIMPTGTFRPADWYTQ